MTTPAPSLANSPQPPADRPAQKYMPERELLARTLELVAVLRSDSGCPWDRALELADMGEHFVEEAYEVAAATLRPDVDGLPEELGDLLLLVLMQAQIASESKVFDLGQILKTLNAKLIRRHPHVFGNQRAQTPADAVRIWQQVKAAEKSATDTAEDSPIPGYLPALKYAREHIARTSGGPEPGDAPNRRANRSELAEQLYELVQQADRQGVDAEIALREYVDAQIGQARDRAV